MTEDMVRRGAQAMRDSKAWPAVFAVGSAETLARACLAAALGEPTQPPACVAIPHPGPLPQGEREQEISAADRHFLHVVLPEIHAALREEA